MTAFTLWLYRDDPVTGYPVQVTVEGTVDDIRDARTVGDPDSCYPAEGGEVEITWAGIDGQAVELTDDERDEVETRAAEKARRR